MHFDFGGRLSTVLLTDAALLALSGLLLFTRNPLHKQVHIVLFQVDVVQRLLRIEGTHDVFKRNQRVLLLSENTNILKFAKHPENLPED